MPHEHLLFRLSGPLASWGEIAVGERRSSWPRPSKSAVLGLVAAALGYDRHDGPAHAALNDGLYFAVRVDMPMRAIGNGIGEDAGLKTLRDYHTAQVPSARRGKKWGTRAEELNEGQLTTILSERWYWINMVATVALWPSGKGSQPTLSEIAAALREPVFALYLGRKSCPPSLPFNAKILQSHDFHEAFRQYDSDYAIRTAQAIPEHGRLIRDAILCALTAKAGREIWADLEAVPEGARLQTYSRRDAIRDRRSWTFSDRAEARIEWGGGDVSLPG